MLENFRSFEATDLFGNPVQVEFRWLQNGIAIRHADTVDVKFELSAAGGREEKVIALPHPALLAASSSTGHPLTDPWCSRIAAQHLVYMLESGEDIENELVTLNPGQVLAYAEKLRQGRA